MQKSELQVKIKNFFSTFAFLTALLPFYFLLFPFQIQGQVRYPISELGSCRDKKECRLYCEVPQNKPACWSYDVYVRQANVLGEETSNVTFPIVELGNCNNAKECKEYCAQKEHFVVCQTIAKKFNIGQYKKIQGLLDRAKQELGCTSVEECKKLCSLPENKTVCQQLVSSVSPQNPSGKKSTIACRTKEECLKICEQNPDMCPGFKKTKESQTINRELKKKELEDKYRREKLQLEQKKLTPKPTYSYQKPEASPAF